MRRFWMILTVVLLLAYGSYGSSGLVPVRASNHLQAPELKKKCHTVTKKVHGKKKKVKVCKPVKPKPTPTPATPSFPYTVSSVTKVAALIGSTPNGPNARLDPYASSINDTTQWGICGGDLGSLTVLDGVGYVTLGDNFSQCAGGPPGPTPPVWRSNAVGIIPNPADFTNGLHITRWISKDGKTADEVIPSQHDAGDCQDTQKPDCEVTTIPTYTFSVQGNLFLAFMSVHHWGDAGSWDVNYSSFALSPDHGKTWDVEANKIKWGAKSNFAQLAVAPDPSGHYLLFYGIPGGRFGEVKLMRAPNTLEGVLDPQSYQYFTGSDAAGQPAWSNDEGQAAVDTHGVIGELSVIYDPGLKRWLMTDLEENDYLAIRSAPNYWGPWSDTATLATQGDYPALYGAFMEPHFLSDDGHTVYFVMSQFGPYRIFWMRAVLKEKGYQSSRADEFGDGCVERLDFLPRLEAPKDLQCSTQVLADWKSARCPSTAGETLTSTASAITVSKQPGPSGPSSAFSKMRARARLRADAVPMETVF